MVHRHPADRPEPAYRLHSPYPQGNAQSPETEADRLQNQIDLG
jgi:hypothetical protein